MPLEGAESGHGGVSDGPGVGVAVSVGPGVGVSEGRGVGVGSSLGLAEGAGVGVGVGVGVGFGGLVGQGAIFDPSNSGIVTNWKPRFWYPVITASRMAGVTANAQCMRTIDPFEPLSARRWMDDQLLCCAVSAALTSHMTVVGKPTAAASRCTVALCAPPGGR